MQLLDGALIFSATDLVGFLACPHLTQLDLQVARGERPPPGRTDPVLEALARRGLAQEQAYLDRLRAEGRQVVAVPRSGDTIRDMVAAHEATVAAMRAGADVIYQAALFDGRWHGYADFLLRVDAQTTFGTHGYEVADAKLARHVRPEALLQTCAYADLLTSVQGRPPERVHVALGGLRTCTYRLADFAAYYRATKRRFEEAIASRPATYPIPVEHCAVCAWQEVCAERRRADDHLSLVAGIRGSQVRALEKAGVSTVSDLATACPPSVPGISHRTLERLREQATLHVRQRRSGKVCYTLLRPEGHGQGLAALPEPSAGDLFLDLEGDPYIDGGGREYLFGIVELVDGQPIYHALWAHDEAQERAAFIQLIDLITARLDAHPTMHVYHYASYEPTALKRLMGRHGVQEAEMDRLLRQGVFVDLYRVVRQSLRVSQESYSVKMLEPLYMEPRQSPITDAAASLVAYERWLETGDDHLLTEIARYNEDDCLSTWRLREWLEARRQEAAQQFGMEIPRPQAPVDEPSETLGEVEADVAQLVASLTAGIPEDPDRRSEEAQARWLLAHLLQWHRREARAAWWAFFERCAMSDAELVDDPEALGDLQYAGVARELPQSIVFRYRFDPSQEHRLLPGETVIDPRTRQAAGTIERIDPVAGILELRRSRQSRAPHPRAVIPKMPLSTTVLRQALQRLARWTIDHGVDGPGRFRAARDLLLRRVPRIRGHPPGAPLRRPEELPQDAARRLALALDASYLAIQGPPGSGKTFTGAQIVIDLIRAGRRVGITALSHRAISNLLDAVASAAAERGVPLRALQKAQDHERCASPLVAHTGENADIENALRTAAVDLVAGTPWLFSREALAEQLYTLVIDEAAQLSLANVLAVAGAARNLVLLGDPRQLAQPSAGSHPPGAAASAMEHILAGEATIAPDRGLLLDVTWRLHPTICDFVSEIVYDGRLRADASCARQTVVAPPPLSGSGIRFLPTPHSGNRTTSAEEAERLATELEALLGHRWVDRSGIARPLTLEDVLVVAPFNAQVHRLLRELPEGARVGTVDRFQGQEAAVAFLSLATSSIEELPRGLDFLFSLNRLNVAVSRAQALSVVVCNPDLVAVRCRTVEHMQLVNAFCRLMEMAGPPIG